MDTLTVTLIEPDGTPRVLKNVKRDRYLMEVAREANVQGIYGDCGGSCSCATCHVYVAPEWQVRVGPPAEIEAGLLDGVETARAGSSRLSCQILLQSELDGLTVTVAPQP